MLLIMKLNNIIKIRYALDFSMAYEDSEIPLVGRATIINNVAHITTGPGPIVCMDARMKKVLYLLQGKLEKIELSGWLSIQDKKNDGSKYVVFHVCNFSTIDVLLRQIP